jgi:hypothetical protein
LIARRRFAAPFDLKMRERRGEHQGVFSIVKKNSMMRSENRWIRPAERYPTPSNE